MGAAFGPGCLSGPRTQRTPQERRPPLREGLRRVKLNVRWKFRVGNPAQSSRRLKAKGRIWVSRNRHNSLIAVQPQAGGALAKSSACNKTLPAPALLAGGARYLGIKSCAHPGRRQTPTAPLMPKKSAASTMRAKRQRCQLRRPKGRQSPPASQREDSTSCSSLPTSASLYFPPKGRLRSKPRLHWRTPAPTEAHGFLPRHGHQRAAADFHELPRSTEKRHSAAP